ncbi:MAG: type II toxin-antitoxin system Phd/YefM family antitoxin [Chloroflexi bacterium]|nr:type II toxin-antitoxin system Phd/YefM family antitoxin [Chloroflexota bacterium]
MNKIIGVTELQRKFRVVFDEVVHKHTPYILTRGSRPEAVLIPYEQYVKFIRADEAGVIKRMEDSLAYMARVNAQYSDEEVEADLIEATRIVRSRKSKSDARRH